MSANKQLCNLAKRRGEIKKNISYSSHRKNLNFNVK